MARITDADFLRRLGNRITARRQWLDLSQDELARRIGVTGAQVHKYERGIDQPGACALVIMAKALGISVAELMGETDATDPEARAHIDHLTSLLCDIHVCSVIRRLYAMPESDRKQVHAMVVAYDSGRAA